MRESVSEVRTRRTRVRSCAAPVIAAQPGLGRINVPVEEVGTLKVDRVAGVGDDLAQVGPNGRLHRLARPRHGGHTAPGRRGMNEQATVSTFCGAAGRPGRGATYAVPLARVTQRTAARLPVSCGLM